MTDFSENFRKHAISSKSLELALSFGQIYGSIKWSTSSSDVQDDDFEIEIFSKYKNIILSNMNENDKNKENHITHIISEAYDVGGHTKILRNFITAAKRRKIAQDVIVSRASNLNFEKFCAENDIKPHILRGPLSMRVKEIVEICKKTKVIILYIHPDDLVSAISARALREIGKKVLYLNHADHTFSFGIGASSCLLEVSGYGWEMSENRRKYLSHSFVGIPIGKFENRERRDRSFILSIGSSRKYEPREGINFQKTISEIIRRTGINIKIIGTLGEEPWWEEVKKSFRDKIKFYGTMTYDSAKDYLENSSCYIDSFPITGGTALTEALAAGNVIFAPPSPTSGYGVADHFRSSSLTDMVEEIVNYVENGKIYKDYEGARRFVIDYFGSDACFDRVMKAASGEIIGLPTYLKSDNNDLNYFTYHKNFSFSLPRRSDFTWLSRLIISFYILKYSRKNSLEMKYLKKNSLILWCIPKIIS